MSAPATPPSFRDWLTYADDDERIARTLMRLRPPSLRNACYHAQQSAEKTLKAFLVHHGVTPPKPHDCTILLTDCAVHDASLALHHADCSLVTRYGIAPRSPDMAIVLTRQDAKDALAAMGRIRAAVLALLPA